MTRLASQQVLSRFDGIQVLRFVASALVLVAHATIYTAERLDPAVPVWRVGGAGVDIFFVISGFVIVLAGRGRGKDAWVSWRSFLAKRVLRIYPMYWLATMLNLAVLIVLPKTVLHSKFEANDLIQWFLLIPTRNADDRIEPLLGVGWTLYFETFFYALFALTLALRRSPYVLLPPILIACALASALRQPDWPAWTVYLDPRVLEFLLGMLVALAKDRLTPHPRAGAVIAVAGFVLLFMFGAIGDFSEFCVRAAASALIVAGTVALEPWLTGRVHPALLFFGAASYAIYLMHPLIVPAVPMVLAKLHLLDAGLSIVGCISAGLIVPCIVYQWVERPILAFGSTWLRRRGADVQPGRGVPPEVSNEVMSAMQPRGNHQRK
jgi:exopolysaccharide production protein ExoZ